MRHFLVALATIAAVSLSASAYASSGTTHRLYAPNYAKYLAQSSQQAHLSLSGQRAELKAEVKLNRDQILENRALFKEDYASGARVFLTGLTLAQKKALNAALSTASTEIVKTRAELKAALASGSTGAVTQIIADLRADIIVRIDAFTEYVAPETLAAFNTFKSDRLALYDTNKALILDSLGLRAEFRSEVTAQFSILAPKVKAALQAELDAVPMSQRPQALEASLKSLDRLRSRVERTRSPRRTGQLAAIAEMKTMAQTTLGNYVIPQQ